MTDLRVQCILKTDDAISANYVTNSWCISSTDYPSDAEMAEYTVCFKTFYDDMRTYLGSTVAQNGHECKYYDLAFTTPPNYPIAIDTFNLTSNPTTDGLPSEVALCLSFQGVKVPGFPQSRRRGRIYFGPIISTQSAGGRPAAAIMTALANAAISLDADLLACSNAAKWAVWSTSNADAVPVKDGWIDNAFDTQRRRGVDRTSRTTWAV